MPSLESHIDQLFQGPLDAFVPSRAALAKTLAGADAERVKRLQKPTAVPWAVNQVYWHARPVYDRLLEAGRRVRAAQIAALGGRSADVPAATDRHRRAGRDAVACARRLAAEADLRPDTDALTRAFEALSLAAEHPEQPGRLARPLQPAGFEALAGVHVKPSPLGVAAPPVAARRPGPRTTASRKQRTTARIQHAAEREQREAERARQRHAAIAQRRHRRAIAAAEAALAKARSAEVSARAAWERCVNEVHAAEETLERLARQPSART
jgi:hypothetical protein